MVQQQGNHFIIRDLHFIEVNSIFDNLLLVADAVIEATLFQIYTIRAAQKLTVEKTFEHTTNIV